MAVEFVSARRAAEIVEVSSSYIGRLVRGGTLYGFLDGQCRLRISLPSLVEWALATNRPLNGHRATLDKMLAPFRAQWEQEDCHIDCPGRELDCLRHGCLIGDSAEYPEHIIKRWMENEWNNPN